MGPKAIDRMLALEPPREPLDSLAAVWRDFKWRRLARGHRDPCIEYTAKAPDLKVAIYRAVDSRGEDGKLFFHQGRVWQWNRDEFAKVLNDPRCRKELNKNTNSFHELWSFIAYHGGKTHGIGSITVYDVTARLAAYFGLPARRIYLHGGVIDGIRSIGIEPKGAWVDRKQLPRAIRYHENLDEVEDFLCGYRVLIERALCQDQKN